MPTHNPRIHVTLEEMAAQQISAIAAAQKTTPSTIARQLIMESLALHEDMYLSKLAEDSEKNTTKWLNDEEVWGV